MKNLIYVCLLALVAISFGCDKEDIYVQEQNRNSEKTEFNNGYNLDQGAQARTGFGDDGSGSGGTVILDGTNYMDGPPPNGDYWTILITYSPGVTETQKREFRVQYQATGELYYFEQCPIDPQKELWYWVHAESDIPCQVPDGYHCERGDNPPPTPPENLASYIISDSCDD